MLFFNKRFGRLNTILYICYKLNLILKIMKEKKVYIDGIGWCREIVVNRYDSNGINTPYCIYEPIN